MPPKTRLVDEPHRGTDWALRVLLCLTGMLGVVVSGSTAHIMARGDVTWMIWCTVGVLGIATAWGWWKITGWLVAYKHEPRQNHRKFEHAVRSAMSRSIVELPHEGGTRRRDERGGSRHSLALSDDEEASIARVARYDHIRYCVTSEQTIVCIKGMTPEFSDAFPFRMDAYSEELSSILEAITDFCGLNRGKVESAMGDRIFLAFHAKKPPSQKVVDAMCVAFFSTRLSSDAFQLTAGVARGMVVKARVGDTRHDWKLSIGGVLSISDNLASAAATFGCQVLYAGEIDNHVLFNYAFAQVDLMAFQGCPGGRCPIFSVTEGAGVDADISLMWVNVSRGDFDGASVLLEQLPETQAWVIKMKARLKNIFAVINAANADHYGVSCSAYLFLNAAENNIKRKNRLGKLNTAGPAYEQHAFLVMRLVGTPETPRKLREGMACFCMSVERFNGTVELLLSDRFIARWVIRDDDFDSVIGCSERLLKVFDGWACGLGLATGSGETVEHRDLTVVCSDARARAECLAMLSYKFGLETVADVEVVHTVGRDASQLLTKTKTSRVEWRVITFEGTFFIPKHLSSAGLVELHRPSNVVYLRAMQEMGEKLWANARELLHQHREIEEDDLWARELLSVVSTAAHQESVGTRGSDDPIHFVIEPAGGRFYLSEKQLQEAEEANCPKPTLGDKSDAPAGVAEWGAKVRARRLSLTTSEDMHTRLKDRKTVRSYLGYHSLSEALEQKMEERKRFELLDTWTLISLVCLCVDIVSTPLNALQDPTDERDGSYTGARVAWVVVGYVCDVVMLSVIIRTLYEPYHDGAKNVLVTDRKLIRQHYIRSSKFALDVASVLPWELLWLAADATVLARHRWVRVNRLLKFCRFPRMLYKAQQRHMPEVHPVLSKLFVHLCVLAYVVYAYGCAWDFIMWDNVTGGVSSQEKYFQLQGYPMEYAPSERVLVSSHFVFRGFSGWGQKWPITDRMFLLSIAMVVLGLHLFATVIAVLQSSMRMFRNELFDGRLDSIVTVAEHRYLDSSTVSDILVYQRRLWSKTKQVYEGQFDHIRDELPEELAVELSYFANIRALENLDVLLSAKDPPFIAQMVSNMSMRFGSPGEQLFTRGDAFKESGASAAGIYFINKGAAVAMVEGEDIEVVSAGGYWGEISCLLGLPQAADFIVRTHCELYYLPMHGFRQVLRLFPGHADVFVQSAARRRETIRGILAKKQADAGDDDDNGDGDGASTADSEDTEDDALQPMDTETMQRIRVSFCERVVERHNSVLASSVRELGERELSEAVLGRNPVLARSGGSAASPHSTARSPSVAASPVSAPLSERS
eukprot:TRINITY_DN13494_c0_g1_i1.p1 TRINITY_DN13494_c0_g1~~TRINITY_DN13494_c0_g1_i1.p1  ORF type:complete len:1320 (+),score=409.29 TRINITY_DN13494_c0_g1_i1:196-4155(+)